MQQAELSNIILSLSMIIGVYALVFGLYIVLLRKTIDLCGHYSKIQKPILWTLLFPIIGFFWNIYISLKIAQSITDKLNAMGKSNKTMLLLPVAMIHSVSIIATVIPGLELFATILFLGAAIFWAVLLVQSNNLMKG